MSKILVKLVRSTKGANEKQLRTVQALGLGKVNSTALHQDNPAIRGMVKAVSHLVTLEEVNDL